MKKIMVILWTAFVAVPCLAEGYGFLIPAMGRIYEKGMLARTFMLPGGEVVGREMMEAFMAYRTLPMKEFVQQYVVASPALSAEIMKGITNSLVGSYAYRNALDIKAKTQIFGDKLSQKIARHFASIEPTQVDGYILSFPKAEKKMDVDAENYTQLLRMEWTLEKALNQPSEGQVEQRFSGAFLPNLLTLEYASAFASHPTTLTEASQKATADGRASKSGFFVIGEHPSKPETEIDDVHRLKDLYILDLEHNKWISYNQSKSEAWKQILAATPNGEYGAQIMPINSLFKREVDTPIRVLDTEKVQVLSNDGETGIISTDALEQFQILGAKYTVYDSVFVPRKEPYYIYLETKGDPVPLSEEAAKVFGIKAIYLDYKVLFAAKKGYPLYNSIREVEYYLKQRNELKEPYLPLPGWIKESAFF